MSKTRAEDVRPKEDIVLANAILDVLDLPSLLVHDTGVILAANQRWRTLFAQERETSTLPTIKEWLSQLDGGDRLLQAIENKQTVDKPFVLRLADDPRQGEAQFAARMTRLRARDRELTEAIILLADMQDHSSEGDDEHKMIDQINYLLVRQTLIEERERRRLGREVHDHVTQLLVRIRRQLSEVRDSQAKAWDPAETVADVDRVIRVLQELTSNFSPPVLEDLGLLPAMHWLAENLQANNGVKIRCEDDGVEPRLSSEVRTVVFRALRELTNNAIKHAPDAELIMTSSVDKENCRLSVRDNGPGFDRAEIQKRPHPYAGYGLLSIEQQIRAVGGQLAIRSVPGDGTHATITLPQTPIEKTEGDKDDA